MGTSRIFLSCAISDRASPREAMQMQMSGICMPAAKCLRRRGGGLMYLVFVLVAVGWLAYSSIQCCT